MLEQVFMKINPNVFKVYNQGIDTNGNVVLAILTQNGVTLSNSELNNLLLKCNFPYYFNKIFKSLHSSHPSFKGNN
jgi:hypothetical protein